MMDEGNMEEGLGILIEQNKSGSFRTSQPRIIDRIIESIPSMNDRRGAKTPAASRIILTKDLNDKTKQEHRNYRSVI